MVVTQFGVVGDFGCYIQPDALRWTHELCLTELYYLRLSAVSIDSRDFLQCHKRLRLVVMQVGVGGHFSCLYNRVLFVRHMNCVRRNRDQLHQKHQDAEDIYLGSDRLVRDCLRSVLIDMTSCDVRSDSGWSLCKLAWLVSPVVTYNRVVFIGHMHCV